MSITEHEPSRRRRRLRLRRPTWRGWFAIMLVLGILGIGIAWAVDYATLGKRVMRNVTVENVDIGRLSGPRTVRAMRQANLEYGKGSVVFLVEGRPHTLSAAEIGLHLDTSRTLRAAHRVGRDDPAVLRPIFWTTSWFQSRRAPVTVRLDRAKLATALERLPGQTAVVEPRVVGSVDAIGTTPGASGYGFDPDRVARQIESLARDGTLPLRVPLVAETKEPVVADAEIEVLAQQARTLSDRTIDLSIPGATMTATPPVLRSWMTSVLPPGSRHARLELDGALVQRTVRQQLGIVVTAAKDATFTVVGDDVLLVPQVDGLRCCSLRSGKIVMSALEANNASAELPLTGQPPDFTTKDARALGITTLLGAQRNAGPQQLWEPGVHAKPSVPPGSSTIPGRSPGTTSSSTTTTTLASRTGPGTGQFVVPIPALQGQSANVDRALPLLRGRIILPGQELSLNTVIGPPSPSRGFVPAEVTTADGPTWISGGGTDLIAAGLFEAAYESGLDIRASTRHQTLVEGVRPGIEATLGWTQPDLVIVNPSDKAVLVWADRSGSRVRIRLFGTPFTERVSTAAHQRRFGPGNACLAVDVTRTRFFSDGRQEVDDFHARYTPPPLGRDDPDRVICPD